MQMLVETPLSMVTQLLMVGESVYSSISLSVRTLLLLVTQPFMEEEFVHETVAM